MEDQKPHDQPQTASAPSACSAPAWVETWDDDDNSIWESPSPYYEDGSPFYWRLMQRLVDNRIEWYDASDAELRGDTHKTWTSLTEAKAMIALENLEHARFIQEEI